MDSLRILNPIPQIILVEITPSSKLSNFSFAIMLRGKLKVADKTRIRAFPDMLGSLVSGSDGKEVDCGESDSAFDSGEELEIIQPNTYELNTKENDDVDSYHTENESTVFGSDSKVRTKPDKDVPKDIAKEEKRSDLEYELSQKEINLEKLQRIANTGLPDGGSIRATAWKLLLGYLPTSHDLWDKELMESRQKYAKLKEELLITPSDLARMRDESLEYENQKVESDADGELKRRVISHEDHPLSLGKSSVWHRYFQYAEIIEQIDRDLQRTHPDINFFSGESSFCKKNREAMKNILIVFAKLNPAIRYVQGMNEVLAPIYYVFCTDTDEQNAANAEADSFACFVRLMSDSVDHFCQQLDNSSVGIFSTLSRLAELLKVNDEELWRHLEYTTKVKPQFYAFRWITLLFTQEFDLQSILRIWDSLLSNPYGFQDIVIRVCCAMLVCVKSRLLTGDFAANLKLLQHYPPNISIEHLLGVAWDITPDTSS